MKVLIDGVEFPCYSSVKVIHDNLEGGELRIEHNRDSMVTDAIVGGTIMATESISAQDNLDTLLEDEPCFG